MLDQDTLSVIIYYSDLKKCLNIRLINNTFKKAVHNFGQITTTLTNMSDIYYAVNLIKKIKIIAALASEKYKLTKYKKNITGLFFNSVYNSAEFYDLLHLFNNLTILEIKKLNFTINSNILNKIIVTCHKKLTKLVVNYPAIIFGATIEKLVNLQHLEIELHQDILQCHLDRLINLEVLIAPNLTHSVEHDSLSLAYLVQLPKLHTLYLGYGYRFPSNISSQEEENSNIRSNLQHLTLKSSIYPDRFINLNFLSKLQSLETSFLDINNSCIDKLTNLTKLSIHLCNDITDINTLVNITDLDTSISFLDNNSIKNLTKLKRINIRNNPKISPYFIVNNCKDIEEIIVEKQDLFSLTPFTLTGEDSTINTKEISKFGILSTTFNRSPYAFASKFAVIGGIASFCLTPFINYFLNK